MCDLYTIRNIYIGLVVGFVILFFMCIHLSILAVLSHNISLLLAKVVCFFLLLGFGIWVVALKYLSVNIVLLLLFCCLFKLLFSVVSLSISLFIRIYNLHDQYHR